MCSAEVSASVLPARCLHRPAPALPASLPLPCIFPSPSSHAVYLRVFALACMCRTSGPNAEPSSSMAEEIARLQTALHQANAALEEQKKQVAALTTGPSVCFS